MDDSRRNREVERVSVSLQDISKWKEALGIREPCRSRVSAFLVTQLRWLVQARRLNVHAIVDEIHSLDGLLSRTSTKKARCFRYPPLRGLWHQHFFDASYFVPNVGAFLGLADGGNGARLDEILDVFFKEHAGQELTPALEAEMAFRILVQPFEDRARRRRLTGEWIVFAKAAGRNVYLSLGFHRENHETLANQIRANCGWEFPFLLKNQSSFD